MGAATWFICPVCWTGYRPPMRTRAGQRCGDLSQGQPRRCVGRIIAGEDLSRAAWRLPEYWAPWMPPWFAHDAGAASEPKGPLA
jgi:hypothetical protein